MEFTVFFSKTFVRFFNTNKIKVTQIYNLFSILEDLMNIKAVSIHLGHLVLKKYLLK